ncbi:CGNR zinc finger domain-containing protein [Nocardioides sp. Kera G14]|uniref:CGNR zinc finger domain-containing protein n=1 Tax=Nocardioides sp. Kera G14 TaxID=2884264 RepID=UPI001D0F8E17|nr:CGNR zinc finger domain-containing protein [Nocardioides sp. Kera G14]UDY24749.1 CGNR zinc finger domain-containing protein [Nocardioides sp. Kera G14]
MVFAHDTELTLQAVVELVNTADDPDGLTSVDQLQAFRARWEWTGRYDGTKAELEAVRALRGPLRALLLAGRDEAAEMVNAILDEAGAVPRLVRHETLDWHIHAEPPNAPFVTQLAVETAMAMVDVIRDNESSRIAVCAADDCDSVALDLSRNRSKRFCSTTCGNRAAVQAYRARNA